MLPALRRMSTLEASRLQGFSAKDLDTYNFYRLPPRVLQDYVGNAFATTVLVAAITSMFVAWEREGS